MGVSDRERVRHSGGCPRASAARYHLMVTKPLPWRARVEGAVPCCRIVGSRRRDAIFTRVGDACRACHPAGGTSADAGGDAMPITSKQRGTSPRVTKADARSIRDCLSPFDGWPRDGRAWARRDRIEALLSELDTAIVPAPQPTDVAARLMTLVAELEEWLRRERAFLRAYPITPPSDWTRRELSPAARRKSRRAWKPSGSSRTPRPRVEC